MSADVTKLSIKGARQHNLKNIDVEIPKNKLVVFTGVSGSGKTSLAMDTIYAEGQRRYVESLSSYARQFLGVMDKPDVDSIEGLSPAIAISQKTTSKNPRSTVGTVTEIYDFLRLLFARVGHPYCPTCGREISRQSSDQIVQRIFELASFEADYKTARGVRCMILAPVVRDRKGEYSALLQNLKKQGIVRARIDGIMHPLTQNFDLIKTNKHTIEGVIARFVFSRSRLDDEALARGIRSELFQAVETALRLGTGNVVVTIVRDKDFEFTSEPKDYVDHLFSENFACPACNLSLPDIEPRTFSFNSPHGACPQCDGLGSQLVIEPPLIMNPKLSIDQGGIFPWATLFDSYTWTAQVIKAVAQEYGFSISAPIEELTKEQLNLVLYGAPAGKKFKVLFTKYGETTPHWAHFEGVIPNLMRRHRETKSEFIRSEIEKFMVKESCPLCHGARLKKEALAVVIDHQSIWQVVTKSITDFQTWVASLGAVFSAREQAISEAIIKEINYRIQFLLDVGLGYLSLSRDAADLSGGEAQRIRLASQIGSGLSGVLYVLDEPSIGLHQRDQNKLIQTLKHLRDLGNTVIVVEHDGDTMLSSDYIFDFGPGAGERGGEVVAQGTPDELKANPKSLTGLYLSGKRVVGKHDPEKVKAEATVNQRKDALLAQELANTKKFLEKVTGQQEAQKPEWLILEQAQGRNLKGIDLRIPLGKFVCVTGVSGSGKSTLIMDTLYTALRQEFGLKIEERPLPYKSLTGLEAIEKVIAIDQAPIGRTPKSNPATYTKTFDFVRELFAQTQDARIRGYDPGRFSFNVKGGRCEACGGEGQIRIEMQFMPDVYINCEVCGGKRYNKEALEIYYKGKNIAEVLDMTVDEALQFFEPIPSIHRKLETLQDVGLGYIKLGQPAPTLSGGEAQRVKLALELSKKTNGGTFYILDEPTTGLHFADLERLITIFKRFTARGSTVVVIEHNLDIIANADWIIDLGPEGGNAGGELVFEGPLAKLLENTKSYTAQAVRERKH